ncbi:MAG: 2-oxo acid dehydrogenase subunit E2 [Chloroflexi bacterium]|nr:2-oxo acid dehydrogenase subunit E2 [Chloroflexota bacterium]
MPAEIVMPRMSDTMETGKVLRWLKREGQAVQKGEPLAEIETDKATMELESYESGTIERILVAEGQEVPIGTPIVLVERLTEAGPPGAPPRPERPTEAGPAGAPSRPPAEARAPAPQRPAAPTAVPPFQGPVEQLAPRPAEAVRASPIARRIAEEQGIDLRGVVGTGPGGRITREDVEEYVRAQRAGKVRPAVAAAPAAPGPFLMPPGAPPEELKGTELVEPSRMLATIARRMTQSKTTVPHYYVATEVDMGAAATLRQQLNDAWAPDSVTFNDLVVRAAALALRVYPQVNASYQDGKIGRHRRINVGVAVAVGEGLLVPVLHDADQKDLRSLAIEARTMVARVREEHARPEDFTGGTFTISNLGMIDVEEFFAIINPPESAILTVASIRPRPVVKDGQLAISSTMALALSADHRVFAGATAAEFLREVKRLLEQPLTLLR